MIDIFNDLQDLNKPVYHEGDAPKQLPAEFYTVSEDATLDNINADNEAKQYLYEYTLKWYTKDRSRLYTGLQAAITLLKSKGYIISGLGYQNSPYNDTWVSRQVDVNKLEDL